MCLITDPQTRYGNPLSPHPRQPLLWSLPLHLNHFHRMVVSHNAPNFHLVRLLASVMKSLFSPIFSLHGVWLLSLRLLMRALSEVQSECFVLSVVCSTLSTEAWGAPEFWVLTKFHTSIDTMRGTNLYLFKCQVCFSTSAT